MILGISVDNELARAVLMDPDGTVRSRCVLDVNRHSRKPLGPVSVARQALAQIPGPPPRQWACRSQIPIRAAGPKICRR